jgi:hypothetical protein
MRWVPIAAACACLAGCFTAEVGIPCDGTCEPDVGGGWVPVLVGTAPECPDVAPYASLAIASPPLTACGVAESEGGCPAGLTCVPEMVGWKACILRDGAHDCPTSYEPLSVAVPHESICCHAEDPMK